MKFNVVVHPEKNGVWTVECPSIPGCVSHGSTKEEALKNVTQTIARKLKEQSMEELPTSIEPREFEP